MSYRGRAEERKKEALDRQALAASRPPQEQLAQLDAAFGVGAGAKRERAKLKERLAAENEARNGTKLPKKTKS